MILTDAQIKERIGQLGLDLLDTITDRLKCNNHNCHPGQTKTNDASQNNDEKIMDKKALSKYLQVKPSWIDQNYIKKKIPYFMVGNKPRFLKSEVDKWIKKNGFSLIK